MSHFRLLAASDLIRTVAVAPTPRNVAVLGLIVLIRTFLSVDPGGVRGQPSHDRERDRQRKPSSGW